MRDTLAALYQFSDRDARTTDTAFGTQTSKVQSLICDQRHAEIPLRFGRLGHGMLVSERPAFHEGECLRLLDL